MHQLLKITAAGLVVAVAAGPAFGQGGAAPKQQQQAPRDTTSGQSGPNQPSTTGTDSSGSTSSSSQDPTKGGTIRGENMPRGTMRDGGKSDTGSSSTGSTSGTGSTSSTDSTSGGMRGSKASNSQVRQVQEALKAQGHDPGPVDGVMGPQTQDAIRAYQRSQNLTETGRLDAQTSQKLGVGSGSQSGSPSSGSTSGSPSR